MLTADRNGDVFAPPGVRPRIWVAVAILLATVCVALYGAYVLTERERARDVQLLQTRMTVVADSRADAIGRWLEGQYDILDGLADNASLQIYIKVVSASDGEEPLDPDPANLTYLRTLLEATASRSGFQPRVRSPSLPANVRPLGDAGIALIGPQGDVIVATAGMPPLEGRIAAFLDQVPQSERGLLDLSIKTTETPQLGFVVPVLTQEPGEATSRVIARVLGVRSVGTDFYDTLAQPGATAQTAESYLIRQKGGKVEYLTPLKDGSRPLTKRLALNTANLVDVDALSSPGRFHSGRDYAARAVFAVSREIPGTPWALVHKIERAEALAATDDRRNALMAGMALLIVTLAAAFVIVWRYATSLRAEEAARQYKLSSERFAALSELLDTLMDSQPLPIFVTTASGEITFANQRMADLTQVPKEELPGRSLLGMLGQQKGGRYLEIARQVLESGQPRTELSRFRLEEGEELVWRSYHARLSATAEHPGGVLTSIEDLTDLAHERARRERNTSQLIETLVGLVDERDPDSAHQSRYVAWIARKIAQEAGLDASMVEATVQAARLVNIGKIRVPRSLLTKQDRLTQDELRTVHQALDDGPEILKDISFEGPVLETLRQINERVDGRGRPLGLQGDQILLSAQTVALANTFVALVSPRAFRDGKTLEEAESILLEEIGRRFDKRIVFAFLSYLANKGGRDDWSRMVDAESV
ncbi:HD domain-containing phosphohydrolase [Thiorhodococcus minor]|uniref:HD domain-containing phosphohydrolase n=1 Tax=Thiorhodococcus minor TaxID=57489 RepID=UPI001ADAB5FB|nr:HD domain-containing phosphohydrolase [Thiorhodococcus minor]